MDITLIYTLIWLFVGMFVGFVLRSWLYSRTQYVGTIRVIKDSEKTLYSLELEDDPELLGRKRKAVFRVESSRKIPIRD